MLRLDDDAAGPPVGEYGILSSMILLIDNYDSFVHNLARYLRRLSHETVVMRNDAVTIEQIDRLRPQAIVLSPGPCTPNEAGVSLEVVREFSGKVPLLGVCLGHQTIGQAFGGNIVRAGEPMHGRTSLVDHLGRSLFAGLPNPMTACRYHSLVIERASLPTCLEVTASTSDGSIMAVQHREHATYGVQFHPEAILTQGGYRLLANFLELAGIDGASLWTPPDELPLSPAKDYVPPDRPVTF
jgi:anthranilate synthase/aminodeoxychorismate synthase-like glutamine amidotransferase